jgi:hypothetical protein
LMSRRCHGSHGHSPHACSGSCPFHFCVALGNFFFQVFMNFLFCFFINFQLSGPVLFSPV